MPTVQRTIERPFGQSFDFGNAILLRAEILLDQQIVYFVKNVHFAINSGGKPSGVARVITLGGQDSERSEQGMGVRGLSHGKIFLGHALQNVGEHSFPKDHPRMISRKVLMFDYFVIELC